MFNFKSECSGCNNMVVTAVDSEELNGEKYTHVLKICQACKDWDVETLRGTWTMAHFKATRLGIDPEEK